MFTKLFVLVLLIAAAPAPGRTKPLSVIQSEHPPLAAELSSRVAARAARLMQETTGDPRFPFPNAQELAAIKKVAETLIMLGQEVIPAIIGELPASPASAASPTDEPNDAVDSN